MQRSGLRSYTGWSENPISTTVDYGPITDLPFPLVTVCPPRNTFTSLNLALKAVQNRSLDSKEKKELTRWLPEIIFDSDFDDNFEKFSRATNLSRGWYSGDTSISFLVPSSNSGMTVMYSTSALAGTASSPFFKYPYEAETFEKNIRFKIGFDKPKNATLTTNIEINFEFDMDFGIGIIGTGQYKNGLFQRQEEKELDHFSSSTKNFTQKFLLGTPKGDRDPYLFVELRRQMNDESWRLWRTKRNTGMRLSWSYDDPDLEPDYKYRDENKDFIKLANILHSQNNKKQLWREIKTQRNNELDNITEGQNCAGDNLLNDQLKQALIASLFSSVGADVPDSPDYAETISAETLAEAQKMFYYLTRCPNFYKTGYHLKHFFFNLINYYPMKTVLLTLTRLMVTALEKGRENELIATKKGALKK